jgi:membrane protein implicated in regulation of membrane protease activity
MTTRQILGRNSYVLASGLVLMVAAYFVARLGSWQVWLAWIAAVALLYAGFLLLRPGAGTKLGEPELEQLIGSGRPVMLELFSNY